MEVNKKNEEKFDENFNKTNNTTTNNLTNNSTEENNDNKNEVKKDSEKEEKHKNEFNKELNNELNEEKDKEKDYQIEMEDERDKLYWKHLLEDVCLIDEEERIISEDYDEEEYQRTDDFEKKLFGPSIGVSYERGHGLSSNKFRTKAKLHKRKFKA